MSRKHFEFIADDIKREYEYASREGKLVLTELVNSLADTFDYLNSNFDHDKFRQACGLKV